VDLLIEITDENLDIIREVRIYQDGSDSEGADIIEKFIKDNFAVDEE